MTRKRPQLVGMAVPRPVEQPILVTAERVARAEQAGTQAPVLPRRLAEPEPVAAALAESAPAEMVETQSDRPSVV